MNEISANLLPPEMAFSGGADIWILHINDSKPWIEKLDWKLIFLIGSYKKKPSFQVPLKIQELMQTHSELNLRSNPFHSGQGPANYPILIKPTWLIATDWIILVDNWEQSLFCTPLLSNLSNHPKSDLKKIRFFGTSPDTNKIFENFLLTHPSFKNNELDLQFEFISGHNPLPNHYLS